jgi:hypothetical protein
VFTRGAFGLVSRIKAKGVETPRLGAIDPVSDRAGGNGLGSMAGVGARCMILCTRPKRKLYRPGLIGYFVEGHPWTGVMRATGWSPKSTP